MTPLIIAILQIALPEIRALLQRNPNATDAEIIAAMQSAADGIIARGEAFIASKGQPPTP